jgi:hypothetical protein
LVLRGYPQTGLKFYARLKKTMKCPGATIADAKKRQWEVDSPGGEELEAIAKDIMVQPPEIIERVKKVLGD